MFWKRSEKVTSEKSTKLPGPVNIPEQVGRYMVVQMRKDPDWVWKLRGVCQPTDKKKVFYCRVFDESQTRQAGLKVKNWTSLDDYAALILWEGYFDKQNNTACLAQYVSSEVTD